METKSSEVTERQTIIEPDIGTSQADQQSLTVQTALPDKVQLIAETLTLCNKRHESSNNAARVSATLGRLRRSQVLVWTSVYV